MNNNANTNNTNTNENTTVAPVLANGPCAADADAPASAD